MPASPNQTRGRKEFGEDDVAEDEADTQLDKVLDSVTDGSAVIEGVAVELTEEVNVCVCTRELDGVNDEEIEKVDVEELETVDVLEEVIEMEEESEDVRLGSVEGVTEGVIDRPGVRLMPIEGSVVIDCAATSATWIITPSNTIKYSIIAHSLKNARAFRDAQSNTTFIYR